MKNKIAIIFALLLLASLVFATTRPFNSSEFTLYYNGAQLDETVYAKMLTCGSGTNETGKEKKLDDIIVTYPQLNVSEYDKGKNCYWKPTSSVVQGGPCLRGVCKFSHLPYEFRLAAFVPSLNQLFISNTFSMKNYRSKFNVTLKEDRTALVEETTPFVESNFFNQFMNGLLLFTVGQLIVGFLYLTIRKLKMGILLSILAASLISWTVFLIAVNPMLMAMIPKLAVILHMAIAAVFLVLAEAAIIYYINRKELSLKDAIIMGMVLVAGGFFAMEFLYTIFPL